jgi:hypothetical protein
MCATLAADAASKPNPPSRVCVDENCAPDRLPSNRNGLKWHPGHYVWVSGSVLTDDIMKRQFASIDAIANEPNIQGIQLTVYWGELEGPTKGDYSKGFAKIDAFLKKLSSLKTPKRLILQLTERKFAGKPPSVEEMKKYVPAYLASSEYNGGFAIAPGEPWVGGLTAIARVWEKPVMDRLIALSKAYGQRYDSNPYFEMFALGETSVGVQNTNFTPEAYAAQLARFYQESSPAWQRTQLRLLANYLGSDAVLTGLMKSVVPRGNVAIGGPDPELPLPNITRSIQANRIFRAERGNPDDLRGRVAWVGEQQEFGLGTRITQTPQEIFDYQYNIMRANYMIWLENTYTGGDEQKFRTGILPFIRSINGKIHKDCPSAYGNRCVTS